MCFFFRFANPHPLQGGEVQSISIKNEKWAVVGDENIWFYPKASDSKYRISTEELPYFLFWLSKSKNIGRYFKNIVFEFDITDGGIYFGYFKTKISSDDYSKAMYMRYQRFNFENKKIVINTLINTLGCDYILMFYRQDNLNLFFQLSQNMSLNLKEILDEIIYENIFHRRFDYNPSIIHYFKKHNEKDYADRLNQKRYKNEKRRLHCNLGNKRGSKFDTEWKNYCKKRDNHTCQCCGSRKDIVVHHKNGYHRFPSLRTAKSNGVVLCRKCHNLYHSQYGRFATQEDFSEFMIRFSNKHM